jgi:hypothetical protein
MKPATISNLEDHTTEHGRAGSVHSIQTADLSLPEAALRELWTPMYLERLARTYWRFLTRVTLGLVRVRYTPSGRSLVLLAPALKLITFAPPEYEMDANHGLVRWRIIRGLLVARRGRDGGGYLQIEVRRRPGRAHADSQAQAEPAQTDDARAARARVEKAPTGTGPLRSPTTDEESPLRRACLHVEIEVSGFYPAIASGLGRRIYAVTQSRIHVIVTRGFLRSLARLDLAESRVGRFASPDEPGVNA